MQFASWLMLISDRVVHVEHARDIRTTMGIEKRISWLSMRPQNVLKRWEQNHVVSSNVYNNGMASLH